MMKTADLIGPALDWAVAICEGHIIHAIPALPPYAFLVNNSIPFRPSRNWGDGGPIIEREKIDIEHIAYLGADPWGAMIDTRNEQTGPTPLIAAMRCYVASKLGDEVDVPEELT
jgi:hypothetical protein